MNVVNIGMFIITVLCGAVTYFIIPYLKARLSAAQLDKIKYWAETAVRFFEENIDGSKQGVLKKSSVIMFLTDKGFNLTEQEFDMIIDAIVNNLNCTEWSVKNGNN